ncbi:twin-arginine translocase subunit TatC [Halorubrum lacusprofundi]|jgi:sec-independent protein translocase protein TatC|uniref:Sec-independent protein translocase protein TatC n=1 Tax=Halorubrum lacusprofundi (strain ATCC 49239 / DSM 5036 / JCM 8891 / ACAM 34) TaxID=416348 RepID=B9LTY6_HALLT|nr:twin-arginine translocase subunit TatC [Halorubrum lacusprofundi]ACM58180.1 Sec-independent periplasmic protein translocase [Halorubrum lacusprofundi ATCC 49239]MCG1006264.1 twin-arginine translocase subunit TatC [Halorubrum lacusprofundi]
MDDSDRSRDEPSAPEDDSVDGDGTVDSADATSDEAVGMPGGTSENRRSAGDENGDDTGPESVEPEVSPEVTSEIGADAGDADNSDSSTVEDAPTVEDGGVASERTAIEGTAESDEEFAGLEAPETDEEMPLAAHIEEMMRRLAVVFVFGGLATLVVVTESTELINYFWGYHIPAPLENRPRLYGPLELPLTRLKVAGLAGVVVGLPAFVYQTYRFMKPGLYENERRYYLAAVPTSLILGGIGIAFAHFLVLPAIFSYFTTYTSDAATIAFGLAETFNLIVIMLAFMAIVFQIPLFIMLAIMMNLVTRQWLEAKRLIFWGSFLGIAFLFSPDPTGMAPIIVTLTMIVLYEGTLAVLRWTGN